MRYFRLLDDVEVPNRWYLSDVTYGSSRVLDLLDGVRRDPRAALSVEISHAGRSLDFCCTAFAGPVVTIRLAEAMLPLAGFDMQLLAARVGRSASYKIVNVLHPVVCLDEKRSKFTKWTVDDLRTDLAGQYRNVEKLCLDAKLIPAARHIFRIAGYRVVLVVSDQLRKAMVSSGCTGAKFVELEQ